MDRPPGIPPLVTDAAAAPDPPAAEATAAPAEPRQRWRIVFARDEPGERPHREVAEAWIAALLESPLPLPRTERRPRPPVTFAAPLPTGVAARREYADLLLADRLPISDVRAALLPTVPAELRVVELHDVWLGAPALQAVVAAADYQVELRTVSAPARLAAAAVALMDAPAIPRERARGARVVAYDLRPLLGGVEVDPGPPLSVRIQTCFDAERGAGRPEEVVAALADAVGEPVEAVRTVRDRLILFDGTPTPCDTPHSRLGAPEPPLHVRQTGSRPRHDRDQR